MKRIHELRRCLEQAFSPETSIAGTVFGPPSSGHCAAVAVIVMKDVGGDMVSTRYNGCSHWFNRVYGPLMSIDVDLTGDQFGLAPVRIAGVGLLFDGTRVRHLSEVSFDTLSRARKLAERAGLLGIARMI